MGVDSSRNDKQKYEKTTKLHRSDRVQLACSAPVRLPNRWTPKRKPLPVVAGPQPAYRARTVALTRRQPPHAGGCGLARGPKLKTENQTENMKTITAIIQEIVARRNCVESGNEELEQKHGETIKALQESLPSGSGFDSGTEIDVESSGRLRLVLTTAYHHMNDGGFYDGWTSHTITVRPDLLFGFTLTISGKDKNDIKDYIGKVFTNALNAEVKA